MTDAGPRGRFQLIMIGLVFLGPLLLAYFLYNAAGDWLSGTGTEHGQLLQPARSLPDPLLNPVDGEVAGQFRGKWSLIVVGEDRCADECREALYETRQVQRALGRDSGRVQRVVFIAEGEPDFRFLEAEHPGLVVLAPGSAAGWDLRSVLGERDAGDVFLADPLGNLIMRFPYATGMRGIHDDLKHLLKVSRIG
jgi:hypothetical protein